MYFPRTTWTWAFLLVTILQAVIALALEIYVFVKFQDSLKSDAEMKQSNDTDPDATYTNGTDPVTRAIPTYLSVYGFGFIYEILLAWDALRLKNTIQVLGLCLYNFGMLIYSAIQKDQIKQALIPGDDSPVEHNGQFWDAVSPYLISVPCVIAFITVLMSLIAWKLYDEFAWTVYKHISADLRMKRRYLTFQIYIALLKFDFFFFIGFTIQFLVIIVNRGTEQVEFWLTLAAIPITIVILLMAAFFTRREKTFGMIITIFLYFGAMAYFLFKLVRILDKSNEKIYKEYAPARNPLTTFAVITILLLIVTIGVAIVCTINFNKGLKPHIAKRRVPDADDKPYSRTEMAPFDSKAGQGRMTID